MLTPLKKLSSMTETLREQGWRALAIRLLGGPDRVQPTEHEIAAAYSDFAGGDVDEWHFPMMNDAARSKAYETALGKALKGGGTVLEIGTGSGLLAMIAARQGATKVITCEAIGVIARKATEIVKQNGLAGKIQVINKKSTELAVGKDLAERADVLVAEIFDNGLIGEEAFSSFEHAKKNLLKPDAQIIPSGAKIVGICIESQEIYEMHRVSSTLGFDVSAFNEFARRRYKSYHLDRYNYRALTARNTFFDFEFNRSQNDASAPLEFEVQHAGLCHAVVYWFELRLDKETTIDTGPHLKPRSSWEQAVYCLDKPVQLTPGKPFKVMAHHDSDRLWFDVL
ncbi:MAG: 50S ribosomal protein L11 methyltransferase [Deltaproteobacteria bacterium]|nr:50S ribosomal protein L11 methyltransferase [Deltaproteobacteria bacterium]